MKNWKTTLVGLICAVANGLYTIMLNGTIDGTTFIQCAFMAAIGFFAKDFNV